MKFYSNIQNLMEKQILEAKSKNPNTSMDKLLYSGNTWEVK